MWQSNNDPVEEAVFSDNCGQPECTTCTDTAYTQWSRFAWPYLPLRTWPFYPYGPVVACGETTEVQEPIYNSLSRGYSNSMNYGSAPTSTGSIGDTLTFIGYADYPLAIVAPDKIYHHSSKLQIYTRYRIFFYQERYLYRL